MAGIFRYAQMLAGRGRYQAMRQRDVPHSSATPWVPTQLPEIATWHARNRADTTARTLIWSNVFAHQEWVPPSPIVTVGRTLFQNVVGESATVVQAHPAIGQLYLNAVPYTYYAPEDADLVRIAHDSLFGRVDEVPVVVNLADRLVENRVRPAFAYANQRVINHGSAILRSDRIRAIFEEYREQESMAIDRALEYIESQLLRNVDAERFLLEREIVRRYGEVNALYTPPDMTSGYINLLHDQVADEVSVTRAAGTED